MPEVICEDCGHVQTMTVFDVNPTCEECGSTNLSQDPPADDD